MILDLGIDPYWLISSIKILCMFKVEAKYQSSISEKEG